MKKGAPRNIRIEINVRRGHLTALGSILAVSLLALTLRSETYNVTAYYPSPVGIYTALVTTGGTRAASKDTQLARDAGNVLLVGANNSSGQVAIGTTTPSGILDITSQNSGIVLSRTTTGSVTSPVRGMMIYDTNSKGLSYFDGTTWKPVASPPTNVSNLNAFLDKPTQNQTSRTELYVGDGFISGTFYFQTGPTKTNLTDQDSTVPGGILLGAIPPGYWWQITCKKIACNATQHSHIVDF